MRIRSRTKKNSQIDSCWQFVAAALGVLVLSLSISFTRGRLPPARNTPEPLVAAGGSPSPVPVESLPAIAARLPAAVELDAWQVPTAAGGSLGEQFAQWEQTDPHLRSLAMGTLTRAVLDP